ncbi:response regulator [Thalassobellus suaedae]|uniref:histidine kinase n=1 Tax=Thalassobellus suaedae TaxID=3074124 RepID=A0ABY9Y4L6_9FLAO|nr:response regulator [Flavobacteriaceae bacterium HL-DH10]
MAKSEFSERRIKLVYVLSLFTTGLSLIWFFVIYNLGMHQLANYIGLAVLLFVISAIITKRGYITVARIIYMLAFVLSVSMTSSFVGRMGSVEFILMFALGLPFLIFSFRRERHYITIFSFLPILFWVLLYLSDFNLFTNTHMDPEVAGRVIYPISILSTLGLVTYQLVYFSYLNIGYYEKIYSKREEAIEASNAKSRFLSTMSHEIRTPLNAITGLSHILGDSNPRPDQKENIEALNYSGKILLSLVNNVLDFSKMESTTIELDPIPTNIEKAIKQIKKIHESSCLRKGISMQLNIDKNIPIVWLDIVRFNQVINNLVSNAIKFTEEGGVTLKISKISETNTSIRLLTEITDSGIGVAQEDQEKIWEVFTQASSSTKRLYGGTGLGLPIVKSIVEALGGKVKIESKYGIGSRFYFELEMKLASNQDLHEIKQKKEYNLEGKHVLLVEDNHINVMVGKQILEKSNIEVDVAVNGQIAVDMVQEHHYDLVLMDIQMPVMDGYLATKEIRKFNTDLPILALSASVFMEVKNKIITSGMDGFIYKPFEPDDLLDKIDKAINRGVVK